MKIKDKNLGIEISEVNILPIKPIDGFVAVGSLVVNKSLYLGSIGVHVRPDGSYRMVYPTKKVGKRQINVYHPINKDIGNLIERAIIEMCDEQLERSDDRYYKNNTQDE